LLPAEKLKFNISSAKLEVAQETVKINQAMVDLVKSITELCMIISPAFFIWFFVTSRGFGLIE